VLSENNHKVINNQWFMEKSGATKERVRTWCRDSPFNVMRFSESASTGTTGCPLKAIQLIQEVPFATAGRLDVGESVFD